MTNLGQSSARSLGGTLSIQAMAWAIEQQEIKEPVTRLVLLCLANYAGADGSHAFPSIARLQRDTGLSERSIRQHLRKLETASLIQRGNRLFAVTKIGRADRVPLVYDIIMQRGAPDSPREVTRGTPRPNGGHMTTSRGAPPAPNPSLRSVREPKSALEAVTEELEARFGIKPKSGVKQ
jgi:Helix-turn-helix domain